MKSGPYAYRERKGVRLVSWEAFHGLCKGLAIEIAKFNPTIILGVARGGLYPATLISQLLQKELYPIRLTRRNEDIVKYEHPVWLLKPPPAIYGLRVLVVDEICDTGETLEIVKTQVRAMGASEVRTAVLYAHLKSQMIPDYIGVLTDELVLNPWDREIYKEGKFVFHPEYAGALDLQGIQPDATYFSNIKAEKLAKQV